VQSPTRIRWFDAALIFTAAVCSFGAAAAVALAPKKNADGIAVVFAPWTSAAESFARSTEQGGRFVRFGTFEFIAVVEPVDGDYSGRVRKNGAWFVADPAALAACLKPIAAKKS
jgi:hypothetical protein